MSNIYKTLEKQSTYLVRINPYAAKKNVATPKATPVVAVEEKEIQAPAPVEAEVVAEVEETKPEAVVAEAAAEVEETSKPKRRKKTKKPE